MKVSKTHRSNAYITVGRWPLSSVLR